MFTMDDMLAIVKPHNDKLIAEGRAEIAERKLVIALDALNKISSLEVTGARASNVAWDALESIAKISTVITRATQ